MPLLDATTDRAAIKPASPGDKRWRAMAEFHAFAGRRDVVVGLVIMVITAWLMVHFHDRFWWPPDEGAYGYVASRILAGDVLNRDVQDVHAGYVNFANAVALAVFGDNLVSMRYPLAVLTLAQTGLIFGLLLPMGVVVAAAGAAGMATLSFIQFLNPTAHWYALFMTIAILAALAWIPQHNRGRLATIGFLLVTLFLFRQLTGVLVAMGVLTYLLCAEPIDGNGKRSFSECIVSRGFLALMALGLAGYLFAKADIGAALLFGVGPLAIMIWGMVQGGRSNRDTAILLLRLLTGALVAVGPLALYHLANGSVADWIRDTLFAAITLVDLPFIGQPRYLNVMILALGGTLFPRNPATFVNGLFWLGLSVLALVVSFLGLRSLRREGGQGAARHHALPVVASFYALVAVHYQIPIYLLYTVALSLAALLVLAAERTMPARAVAVGFSAFLCAIGLWFQAAQPLDRGLEGIIAGQRGPAPVAARLAKTELRVGVSEATVYRDLVALIQSETRDGGSILALPFNPEIYYLSGRRNPTRFYNSATGIASDAALGDILGRLQGNPPRLVFFRTVDKYNTAYSARIMEFVRARYERLNSYGGFEIYRYRVDTQAR